MRIKQDLKDDLMDCNRVGGDIDQIQHDHNSHKDPLDWHPMGESTDYAGIHTTKINTASTLLTLMLSEREVNVVNVNREVELKITGNAGYVVKRDT